MSHLHFNVLDVQAEWQYMLSGGTGLQQLPNPAPAWLSERAWQDVMALSALPNFTDLAHTFSTHEPEYRRIFDSNQPHRYPLTLTHTQTYLHREHTGVGEPDKAKMQILLYLQYMAKYLWIPDHFTHTHTHISSLFWTESLSQASGRASWTVFSDS